MNKCIVACLIIASALFVDSQTSMAVGLATLDLVISSEKSQYVTGERVILDVRIVNKGYGPAKFPSALVFTHTDGLRLFVFYQAGEQVRVDRRGGYPSYPFPPEDGRVATIEA